MDFPQSVRTALHLFRVVDERRSILKLIFCYLLIVYLFAYLKNGCCIGQACSSEVMMLRMARKYDYNTNSIVFANNQPYTKDSYIRAGMGETIDDLLRFCRQMWAMKVDNAEYALLTAIVIFSGTFALSSTVRRPFEQRQLPVRSFVDLLSAAQCWASIL